MKQQRPSNVILGAIFALAFALKASATLVTVSSTETWDGVSNPHAGDGVTLTPGDPAIYTIPNGMLITSTGRIDLHGASDANIKFLIEGGNLQMDAGAVLNTERLAVRTSKRYFTLDLSGTNSITGAGTIGQRNNNDSTFRDLTIANVRNISLADVFMQVVNGNRGPTDFANIAITASGSVLVTGAMDNSDRDTGGDGAGDITIKANAIDVNNVDARGFRNDPGGRDPYSGNVTLQALSPVGSYSTTDAVNNASTNRLTVRGSILTFSVDPETIGGNVTLQSVVLQLVFGTINLPPAATKTLQVGKVRGGAAATDLFVDVSSSGQTVAYDVDWGGTFTPPTGSPPVFTVKPVIKPNATNAVAYAGTLAGTATDADLDPLSFTKYSGPAWLQVAADGTLSGTPGLNDGGTNSWTIAVTDGTRFDVATLQIFVATPPRWNGGANITYANGVQNTPYSGTLASNVIYYGGATLTYTKSNGPAWLIVAADGTLSGTPDPTNVLNNAFTVRVSDGVSNVLTTLNIFVNGSPKFTVNPFVRATAFVGQDYALKNQTLAGAATDPQDPANPNTLTWVKVSGPAWLTVDPTGTLGGTPGAGDLGVNSWTVTAANAYPATTATVRINVQADAASAPIEVVNREFWDGVANPHAGEGVTLTGAGTADDPATYTIPRSLLVYSSGQIYTSLATGQDSEAGGLALHIKFNIQGNLTMDSTNNAFVTAIHARNDPAGKKNLFLDLNGTNSIVGQGRIVGLGNRVDAATFPNCFDRDTPRILTITNVNNVSLYDINVQVRNVNNTGRPLLIAANGKVEITSGIDNSDRDTGGEGSSDVNVLAKEIKVTSITTRVYRTGAPGTRKTGNITLKALAPPGYDPTDAANNKFADLITISGLCVATNVWYTNTAAFGAISNQSVVLKLESNASLATAPERLGLNVGKIQGGAVAADLFRNESAGAYTANYDVDWSGAFTPASPKLLFGAAPPGQIILYWNGNGFVLQQNSSLSNPAGWVNAPSGTNNPTTNAIGAGNLFYRLKWPQ